MYVFSEKDRCSGCTACMHSCPQDAISMVEDIEGFKYPRINQNKCINCGICRKICPFHKNYYTVNKCGSPIVYAAKNINEAERTSSSSGGIFPIFSKYVLNKGGIVYGAAFNKNFKVYHTGVDNVKNIDKLKGSKYVQSDLTDIFLEIKKHLLEDRYVLFSGTGCQVAGLKAFLKNKEYEKLVSIDLVCHGTPSPLVWENYVELLQTKTGLKLTEFNFRSKKLGWHTSRLYAKFNNNKELFDNDLLDSYNNIFYAHTALRPSCHSCVFTNFRRTSDITIADFWGIEKHKPEFDDNKGVSLLLINTRKGKKIFNKINRSIKYLPSTMEEATQRNLTIPTKASPKRKQFWKEFNYYGYEYVARKYTTYGIKNRIKSKIIKPILFRLGILNYIRSKIRNRSI